jgi:hypothetical protein
MLDCAVVDQAFSKYEGCAQTDEGLRVMTHCLYPSFEQVAVFIVSKGDGLIVHDGAGAARSAWLHGSEPKSVSRSLMSAAAAFGCDVKDRTIMTQAASVDWLWAAIASVANASSDAARASAGRIRQTAEETLIRKTKAILDSAAWNPGTKLDAQYPGESGKMHTFDLMIEHGGEIALMDAVVSHPNSIAAKYLAFSDTEKRRGLYKYALYDNDLAPEDKTLLSNVADLVAYQAIVGTNGRFLLHG